MKLSQSVKPISYFKSHASEIVRDIANNGKTMVVTHLGEAKVIVQDIREYEKLQETLALLKILSQSKQSLRKGRSSPVREAFGRIRKAVAEDQGK